MIKFIKLPLYILQVTIIDFVFFPKIFSLFLNVLHELICRSFQEYSKLAGFLTYLLQSALSASIPRELFLFKEWNSPLNLTFPSWLAFQINKGFWVFHIPTSSFVVPEYVTNVTVVRLANHLHIIPANRHLKASIFKFLKVNSDWFMVC